jgi:hypothetical protein
MGTTGVDCAFLLVRDRGGMGGPLEVGGVWVCVEGPAACVGLGSLSVEVCRGGGAGCFPFDMGGVGT